MRKFAPLLAVALLGISAAVVVTTLRRRAASDLALMTTPVADVPEAASDPMPVPPGV
jgi:hypothetical protein